MIAFSLKLSAFIIFLVSSFIARGYLIIYTLVTRGTKLASDDRLEGWQARNRKHSRTRGSHDDRRYLDAAILGVHDEQDTT
jgi:hypothetical protein